MLETTFREIVSGQRRGPGAAAMRGLLGCLEMPYAATVSIRNRRYDQGASDIHRAGVPVLSVGNLTLGGTGKTPMVKWVARLLGEQGARVVLLSRGYGSNAGEKNDEALELEQALPDVPHLQNPDRVAAARRAVDELGAGVLLLDDGFQHRRLGRDLDIVLLDATAPFGYGRVFPRGLLREPATGLRRAQVVCLTRANLVTAAEREAIRAQAHRLAPEAKWCEASHAPAALLNKQGARRPLADLAGKRVVAFCGIGNPNAFRATLDATGCEIAAWQTFPDHHRYTPEDMATLAERAEQSSADFVVVTHKDLVKIDAAQLAGRSLLAVEIEMRLSAGQEALQEQIKRATS